MTDQAMSPLRRRMIEDMTIRKFAAKTQHDYLQRVKNFTAYLGRSPDTASSEDVRRYQLHLTASGVGVPTVNQTVSTLRFFFKVTLGRPDLVERTAFVREPRKLQHPAVARVDLVLLERPGVPVRDEDGAQPRRPRGHDVRARRVADHPGHLGREVLFGDERAVGVGRLLRDDVRAAEVALRH